MATEMLLLSDAIGSFAPGQELRSALFLTFSFDGKWLEEGLVPDLFERRVANALVIRDRNCVVAESPSVRYHRANAGFSRRIFHPKLGLFVAADRALLFLGSANLTRGGLERNLELGSAFELSGADGPLPLFKSVCEYVSVHLAKEVEGEARRVVLETGLALREVLDHCSKRTGAQVTHHFLHNYDKPIWTQVLEHLPHRHVIRVSIVSPFFEPNTFPEDPTSTPDDAGIFARLFNDLTLEPSGDQKPVAVYFQQSEGRTNLPIDKLKQWKSKVELYQRLATSEDVRPLHGKMLIIEGGEGRGYKPYLVALHGSPNFTSSALLSTPPDGNAEVALLTHLPPKRNATARASTVMQLTALFGKVNDWGTLSHIPPQPQSRLPVDSCFVTEVCYHMADRTLIVLWRGVAPPNATIHVFAHLDAVRQQIAEAPLLADGRIELRAPALMEDTNEFVSLRSSSVCIEFWDSAGIVLTKCDVPVNVDCPEQFCRLSMTGPVLATLDQRIAYAGCGVPQTYREQQKFLEQHYARKPAADGGMPNVLTHQADLDRFFRNLSTGLRGVSTRFRQNANSEFACRRTIRELIDWMREAVSQGHERTKECSLYLIDRLVRELKRVVEQIAVNPVLSPRLQEIAREYEAEATLEQVARWLHELANKQHGPYPGDSARRVRALIKSMRRN